MGCAGALSAAAVLGAVTPADAGGLLGCTLPGDGVGQLRGLVVEFFCSLVLVFVVCAGLIGGTADDCRASVASTEGSELPSGHQVSAPFVAGATLTGLSVFAVRIAVDAYCHWTDEIFVYTERINSKLAVIV